MRAVARGREKTHSGMMTTIAAPTSKPIPNVEAILSRLPVETIESKVSFGREGGGGGRGANEPLATELNINGTSPMKKDENPIAKDWNKRLGSPILKEREEKGCKPFEAQLRLEISR